MKLIHEHGSIYRFVVEGEEANELSKLWSSLYSVVVQVGTGKHTGIL